MPDPLFPEESWIHRDGREMAARAREAAAADRERQAERDRLGRAARARQARVATPPAPTPQSAPEPPKRRTWRDLGPDELNRYALAESRQP